MVSFFKEIWTWRFLLWELTCRNLKLHFSVPAFGFFWNIFSPLCLVGIYFLVFSVILNLKLAEGPFFLFLLSGIFPWQFFQGTVVESVSSLHSYRNLIKESPFPHPLIPISLSLANFIRMLPAFILIFLTAFIMNKGVSAEFYWLPVALVLLLLWTIALSMIVSIIFVKWRDVSYLVEIGMTFFLYLTPIVYPLAYAQESFLSRIWPVYISNPFVGILALFRMGFIKDFHPSLEANVSFLYLLVIPFVGGLFLLLLAIFFYKRSKRWLMDFLTY